MSKKPDENEVVITHHTPDGPVELTPEQTKQEQRKLRKIIEAGKVEVMPEAADELKKMGLSVDQVLALMIGTEKH